MEGFLVFALIMTGMAGLIVVLRRLRAREMAAFLDADISSLNIEQAPRELPQTATKPSPVSHRQLIDKLDCAASYSLKRSMFDDSLRALMFAMDDYLGQRYRLFVNIDLADFVATETLQGHQIAVLICSPQSLSIVAGVDFMSVNGDSKRADLLQRVFADIKMPLVFFPRLQQFSVTMLEEKLSTFLGVNLITATAKHCDRCDRAMVQRKVVPRKVVPRKPVQRKIAVKQSEQKISGEAAIKMWVCSAYPKCKATAAIVPI
ncbi:MAG: hypothetical protein KUG79_12015 [Pseudomonadales bacterium]|nr:hypothetical protein [Pseudomonadales bacterium]